MARYQLCIIIIIIIIIVQSSIQEYDVTLPGRLNHHRLKCKQLTKMIRKRRDRCYTCHKYKEVTLCGDDLLCHQCDEKNEAGLKLISSKKLLPLHRQLERNPRTDPLEL